jgi:hypothetical protein
MNWGGFAGGLATGINTGLKLGKEYKAAKKENDLENLKAKGVEEATAARESEINSHIKDNGLTGEPSAPAAESSKPATTGSATGAAADSPNYVSVDRQNAITQSGAPVLAEDPMTADQAKAVPVATPEVAARPIDTPAAPVVSQPEQAALSLPSQPGAQTPLSLPPQPGAQAAPATITPSLPATAGLPQVAQAPQKRFMVGNQGFDTREEAAKAATGKVPSIDDFIMKSVVPKQQQFYIQNGEVEKAEALGKYMEGREGKAATKLYGQAMNKLMFTNDTAGGVEALSRYYGKHIDDGASFKFNNIGEDGKINLTLKQRDGKETPMSLSKDDIMRMGMAHDPTKAYEFNMKQVETRQKESADIAKESRDFKREVAKEDRKFGRTKELKTIESNNAIEKMQIEKQLEAANAPAKLKREVSTKIEFLKGAGYSDAFINESLPQILGVGSDKKKTAPDEARRLAFSDRMKSDPTFGRKPAADQQSILDQDMKLIYGGVDPKTAPTAAPAAAGLPAPAGARPKGVPVYDTKTGTIVYR